MNRLIIFLFIYLNFFNSVSGNTIHNSEIQNNNSADSLKLHLITATLNDGTKIWGQLLSENSSQISVNDFNIGVIIINKNDIKNKEIKQIDAAVMIETTNGNLYYGEITVLKYDTLFIRSYLLGNLNIKTNTISKITPANAFISRKGGTWLANPNATRYFFAPSAIPLRKKEGYFQNAYLLANSVNVGISDNISIGGGVVIPLLFYVTPKISFKAARNLYLGGGVLFTQSFISSFGLSAGIGYGLFTYGNMEHNFTIGAGYGFAEFDKKYRTTPMPIVTVNGMTRISKKMSIVTENWLIPRAGYDKETEMIDPNGEPYVEMNYVTKDFYSGAVSLGLRLMPGEKTSVDFSVVGIRANPGQNDIFIPYLDFVYKFN